MTVATVDENVRLQRVETWFDPMEMFRQIAPHGIVNRQTVAEHAKNHKTQQTSMKQGSETRKGEGESTAVAQATDPLQGLEAEPSQAMIETSEKAADERSQASSLSDSSSWTRISESTAVDQQLDEDATITTVTEPPPTVTPEQHAASTFSALTETAGAAGTVEDSMVTYEENPTQYEKQVEQLEASKVDGMQPASANGVFLTGQYAGVPKYMEDAVLPAPGEAVVVPASGEEAQKTHEEMRRVTAMECPFLMNQE